MWFGNGCGLEETEGPLKILLVVGDSRDQSAYIETEGEIEMVFRNRSG